MQIKIAKNNLYGYLCAFAGILSMNPYFLWPSFAGGVLAYFAYIVYALSIILYIVSISYLIRSSAYFKLSKRNLLIGALFLIMYIHIYVLGATGVSAQTLISGLLAYINLFLLATCEESVRKNVFEKFVVLFIVSLIPGLVYYILETIGISLSIGTLQSQNQLVYANSAEFMGNSGYYKLYIGAVMRVSANTRFSGIYDEAGLVGTVSALLLIARKFEIKKDKKCRWLFLFNIISFSLAGYSLIAIYFFIRWIHKEQWKLCAGIIACIVALYGFLNMHTSNTLINNLQSRIEITSTGISLVNNRESSVFDIGYQEFTNASLYRKIMGYGRGASSQNRYMNGSSSYKCVIYDYGYWGFFLMILIITYCYFRQESGRKVDAWDLISFYTVFLISIYQRPAIMYAYYFIILYGGKEYLCSYNKNMQKEMTLIKRKGKNI